MHFFPSTISIQLFPVFSFFWNEPFNNKLTIAVGCWIDATRFKSRGNTYQPSTRKERENWGSWLDSGPLVVEKYLKEEEQRVDGS